MYPVRIFVATIVACFPSWISAQQSGWIENQVNTTMCAWKALRAAQVNDTAYLDGGFLYWIPGLADDSFSTPIQDGNPLGLLFTLNFSIPFNSNTNVSSILGTKQKASNGGAANNFAPNYYDGAILANDHEFFLYGGLLRNTMTYSPPDGDETLGYRESQYGAVKESFIPGFVNELLSENVTRYVTYGGAASAPSENKAWYFGGYRSPSSGPIYQPSINNSINPVNVSDTLITLDLSEQLSEKWFNATLPPGTPSRANPSAVWVPVGEQGILVLLGGVLYPEYNNVIGTSANVAQSEKDSPGYMSNVDVYDVASGEWYQQPTANAPPQLAMGCAVVATAQDASSYNIYYYGGFDGLHEKEDFNDDVWILSLPSFTWTKISSGNPDHARAGHQCLTPYPDQMVTVGGFRPTVGGSINCLVGGILQVFNLTEGKWLDSYDPNNWNMYGVPEMLHEKIGGDYTGGATLTTPTPSGWAAEGLASVFATKYPTSKITPNYPYSSQDSSNGTRGTSINSKGGGGTPSWVAPVLGVVLGLVFVTAVVVGILLFRRRSLLLKKKRGSDSPSEDHLHWIRRWLNNTHDKAQTVTTEEPSSRSDYMESRNEMRSGGYVSPSPIPDMAQHEMPENQRFFELMDTSRPMELSDNPLTYNEVIRRHTQLHSPQSPHSGSPHSVLKAPSFNTGTVSQDPSSLSSSQAGMAPPSVAATLSLDRPDSPSLGNVAATRRTPPANRGAVVSDMSHMSEHHRNLSGGTVSSTSAPSLSSSPPNIYTGFDNGPVSPPLPSPPSAHDDDNNAGDYMSVHQSGRQYAGSGRGPGTSNSLRMSIFRENADDLGDASGQPAHNTR
ncbi:hypothetical protein F5Y03DRAFT_386811 [Xylaria venustula]|nr:hypothetical protein F5Y03DRAFT_386811 [Xylaria venustula]